MEAMLFKKPVITPKTGGIVDHLTHEQHAHLLSSEKVPISTSSRNSQWYAKDQLWGQVNIDEVRQSMRKVYATPEYRKSLSESGYQKVTDSFSLPVVGGIMKKRLIEIAATLEKRG